MKELKHIRLENLHRLLSDRFNGNKAAFARSLGKDVNQVRCLFSPEKPSGRWMGEKQAREFEAKLGLNPLWLDTEHEESNAEPAPKLGKFKKIAVVGTAQLGDNGHWSEIEYPVGHGDGYIEFPSRDPMAYALRCRGDSMMPRIKNGEFVIVEPNSEPINGDEVLIKAVDGRVMVKTLLYIRDDMVHLMSVNESHPPQSMPLRDVEKMHLVAAIVKKALWTQD